ncbi:SprB repeat-containing protein, partial [Crocinitomix catalasitica]|nr:SprB repeat-containing protein [Crocinitomix catalasitica]
MIFRFSHRLNKVLVLISLFATQTLFATDFYWINGSGNWSDASHWSLTSGGTPGFSNPGNTDNVIFDNNSFSAAYPIIQISSDVTVKNFKITSNAYPVFLGDEVSLTIKEGLDLQKKSHFVLNGGIFFDAVPGKLRSINTDGISFNADLTFAGGDWQLKSHFKASQDHSIRFNSGSLVTNDHTIFAKHILATKDPYTFNMGTSTILALGVLNLSQAVAVGDNSMTISAVSSSSGTSTIIDKGDFPNTRDGDVLTLCPSAPFQIEIFITLYNGEDISCPDSCDGEMTIFPSGTPGPYSISVDGGPFTDQTVYSNLCAGTYTVIVIDSSNEVAPGVYDQCTSGHSFTDPLDLNIGAPISFTNSCPDSCDGSAFTFPGGGTPPYVLFWPSSGETTPNPIGLCDGWNVVNMTDVNLCPYTDSVEVIGPPPIIPNYTITPPSCFGDCDAEVLASPTGGNGGPWTYFWSTVPTSGQGTNPGIGFCSGTFTLTVTDNNGCPKDTTVTIIDPPAVTITLDGFTNAICNGDCNGTADITVVGGTPGYTFEWVDNATLLVVSTVEDPTTLCAGDYFVIATDVNGCDDTLGLITIGEPPPFILNLDAYSVSCFGICDGSVDVDVLSGGTPGYTYSWTTFPGGIGVGAADSIIGLCPGFYQVTITDILGCDSVMVPIEVLEPPELTLVLTFTDPTCYDLCDGTATATPGGGTLPYTYIWSPIPPCDGTTATPSCMCAGTYDLLLIDANGCSTTGSVTLTNPVVYDLTVVVTNILCSGDANGAIDIIVNSGGIGAPYTYTWVPVPPVGAGTPNVSGLTVGVWTVTIADANGCDTTLSFTISEPSPLTVAAAIIANPLCNGDCNGSVSVGISGGTTLYNILWDDPGASITPVVSGLCVGTYTVTVTDANGCVGSDAVTLIEPPPFVLDSSQTNIICPGDCDGTATAVVISGGTGPGTYTFQWDDPLLQTTPTAITLCAGIYTVTIEDANLCDTTIVFIITEPPAFTVDTNLVNATCFATCSGEANVVVGGGTPGYTYEWFDAGTGITMGIFNDTITGLCPGDYYAVITDAAGCIIVSDTIPIIELPAIITATISTTDATCGFCDGTADVLAIGGAGGFTYTWTPAPGTGQGTPNVTGLCPGVYSVDIEDAAGCTATMSVTINSLAVEVLVLDSTDASCFGVCDGTITVSWGSLDPPYTLEFFDQGTGLPVGAPISPANPAGETIIGLCAGTYIAVLTNATGCVSSDTISINEPPEITAVLGSTPVSCNGLCDGSATVVAAGGVPGYTYNWVPLPGSGQGTTAAGGLCAGIWNVEVTDITGCTVSFPVVVTEPPALSIDLETSTDVTCFGLNDGTATVSVSGGTAPLSYDWIDCATGLPIGQFTPTATGLGPGDYSVVIVDANGCTVSSSCLPILEPTEITAIFNISLISCFGDCNGTIDVVASGGVAPYFYQWLDDLLVPIPGQTNDTINGICQGFYNLTITDINGCSATFGPFDLTPPVDAWDITEFQTNITCFGSCDGIAGVIVNAGNNPPYTYQWDDPLLQVTPTATNLCAGIVSVTISDAGVCDTTITFTIIDNNPILSNPVITNVLCNGDCTGSIAVSPTGGLGPYTITWSDGQVGPFAVALCAGPIILTITDANGCVLDTTIVITEPLDPLTAFSTFTNPSTCSICNGSATINMTPGSGTPPYSYDWTPDPAGGEGTNMAFGLCAGVISVEVTDANGCTYTETFGISDITGESLTMASTDASCFGVCDGTADVIYVCADPPCTNEWFDGSTGLPLSPPETGTSVTGLCAGDYFVEVINNSGCVSVDFVTINSPTQIIPNETITPITCNGDTDGAIDLVPTGGSGGGYTYVWTPVPPFGAGTANISGLGAGSWCVDITDSDGCIESICFTILDPTPILITPTVTPVSCNGFCNGIISVAVSGGGGGYTYQWLDGAGVPIPGETGPVITNLCPGNYTVEITDANGCIITMTPFVTISEPLALSSPIVGTNVTCFGLCDGTATVTPVGGLPPYSINWYDSGGLLGLTTLTITGLCPEDYYAVIQDANGCNFTSAVITITEPLELTAT